MAEKSVTNMVNAKRHNGFSLIEVLFAVMVLTMGLIFTASQFPIGLMTSRQVTETTLHAVESRNAEVMTHLQLGHMNDTFINTTLGHFINNATIPPDTTVHYWCQPNLRLVDYAILMDDPTDEIFDIEPTDPCDYTQSTPGKNYIPPHIKDHLHDNEPDPGYLAPENIGQLVMPQVNGYDREVLVGMENLGYTLPNDMPFDNGDPAQAFSQKYKDWQDVILGIALERSYSQAMFYRYIGDRRCQVWIFTLSNTNKEAAYAIQDISDDAFADGEPFAEGNADTDRRFPFPWRVTFSAAAAVVDNDRIRLADVCANQAEVDDLLEILRKDSYIIDAENAFLYKILDIEVDAIGDNWLRLDRALAADMQWFWIFPPAIIRGEGFAETQPVVNVTETTISF